MAERGRTKDRQTRGATAAAPPDQRRLPPLLRRAWYGLNQAFRRRIAAGGATPDQYTILRWLAEAGPHGLTQRELADLMASDPNTVTALLDRMEARAWVQRRPHETDRRANRIILRPEGRQLLSRLRPVALALQAEVLAALPEDRRAEFLALLDTLARACQRAADASGPSLGEPD